MCYTIFMQMCSLPLSEACGEYPQDGITDYETDSHPGPQFYPRRPTVNHSKQAGGDNNTNMVELRILYKSTNNEIIQTS